MVVYCVSLKPACVCVCVRKKICLCVLLTTKPPPPPSPLSAPPWVTDTCSPSPHTATCLLSFCFLWSRRDANARRPPETPARLAFHFSALTCDAGRGAEQMIASTPVHIHKGAGRQRGSYTYCQPESRHWFTVRFPSKENEAFLCILAGVFVSLHSNMC